jgi:hypothetical protein
LSTDATPELGVVVVSYNTSELLDKCLASLESEMRELPLEAEVWVIDNASDDGSADMVRRKHPLAQVIELDENRGFAAANNVLLERWAATSGAAPRWVLALNPDTEVRPDAIAGLIGALEADAGAAIAGPRLEYPDGRLQHGAFRFPGLAQVLLDLFPVNRLTDTPLNGRYPAALYDSGRPFRVEFPLGACMLVRGSALEAVGALDDGFFMYSEEIDWSRRFSKAGYHALCVPGAVVVHHAGASTGQRRPEMLTQLWRSRLRYFEKHEPPLRRALLRSAVRAGLRLRLLADLLAVRRGRMTEAERAERAVALVSALRPGPS